MLVVALGVVMTGACGGRGSRGAGGAGTAPANVAGAAGAGGGMNASGGAGGRDSGAAGASHPAWLPLGVFGDSADELAAAALRYAAAICESACMGSAEWLLSCVRAELENFAPSVQWVACSVRTQPNVVVELASAFDACVPPQETAGCGFPAPCSFPSREVAACPAYRIPLACPDGSAFGSRCDGELDCVDGYDELNCDPLAESYRCDEQSTVPWPVLCDGVRDCSNGSDEHQCETAGAGG